MKTCLTLMPLLMLVVCSCSKSTDSATPAPATLTDVKTVLTTGSWSVSSYRQKTEDKTSDFSATTFVFSADGTVVATRNGKTTSGSWTSTPGGVTYYGAAPSVATFTINLGTSNPYKAIYKTWNVNATSTASDLKLDNKEPVEDEHLEFVK